MYGSPYYQPIYNGTAYQPGYMPQTSGAVPDQLACLRGAGQQPQQAAGSSSVVWVQGEAGAKSYLVAPGNTVMLMDSEAEVFYIKSADASGVPMPLRVFDYKERIQKNEPVTQSPADTNQYITREEFEAFRASLTVQAGRTEERADGE